MKYFNENMSTKDARTKMCTLAQQLKNDKKASEEMWEEYSEIAPILLQKEISSPNYMNILTS